MRNEVIEGEGFRISYNPATDCGPETALCDYTGNNPRYLILLGDYRDNYRPLVESGYDACRVEFNWLIEAGAERSDWSD